MLKRFPICYAVLFLFFVVPAGAVEYLVDGIGASATTFADLSDALAAVINQTEDATIAFSTVGPIFDDLGDLGNVNPGPVKLVIDGDVGGQRAEVVSDGALGGGGFGDALFTTYVQGYQTMTIRNLIFRPSFQPGGAAAAHGGPKLNNSSMGWYGDSAAGLIIENCVFCGSTATGRADPFDTTLDIGADVTGWGGPGLWFDTIEEYVDRFLIQISNTVVAHVESNQHGFRLYNGTSELYIGPGVVLMMNNGGGDGVYCYDNDLSGPVQIHFKGEPDNRNLIYNVRSGLRPQDPDLLIDLEYTDIINCSDRLLDHSEYEQGGMVTEATDCLFVSGAQGGVRYSSSHAQVPSVTYTRCTVWDADGNQMLWTGSNGTYPLSIQFRDCIIADPDIGGTTDSGTDIRSGRTTRNASFDHCALNNVYWYANPGCQTAGPTWFQSQMVGTPCAGDAPDPEFISTDVATYLPGSLAEWDARRITLLDDYYMDVSAEDYRFASSTAGGLGGAAQFNAMDQTGLADWIDYK